MKAVLVDTTKCVGCRACEAACAEANGLAGPELPGEDRVFASPRTTSTRAFTVVNRYAAHGSEPERFVKRQCMHCVAPACASACPVQAMVKLPTGPVTYDASRCMGCRYCMIACPFDVPKYEYESAAPRVRKCTFCATRQAEGKGPACAEVCPSGALLFGKRSELIEVAKTRIYQNPGRYVPHVYGEHEVGGTSWLYISDVDFEKLDFPADVGTRAYPDLVSGALGAPPFVMTLWPPLLMGIYAMTHKKDEAAHDAAHGKAEKEDHHG
ncbi:MAG TPA: 4Fe-4S dicluster domain-containing protein [Usitatibacteraceae bacterium]|nr:4Fe-4S dicluster domain-containing protein [Usitatibacteraceae bacterium]